MRRKTYSIAMKALLGPLLILCLAAGPLSAHPGIGVAVDSRGNIYYTDLNQVWLIDPQGDHRIAVPEVHTHELYLDEQDNLFGEHLWYEGERTDRWGHFLWRLSADGEYHQVIPPTVGFRSNYSLVRDRAGNMYWAGESRASLFKRTPEGSVELLAGGAATAQDGRGPAAGFTSIRWMFAEPGGTVFLIDEGALRRIDSDGAVHTLARGLNEEALSLQVVFSWEGPGLLALVALLVGLLLAAGLFFFFRHWGRPRAALHTAWISVLLLGAYGAVLVFLGTTLVWRGPHAVMGLCSDASGNVYVANTGARKLKKVTPRGEVSVVYTSSQGFSPTGCTVAEGTIYVLEYSIPAVRVGKVPAGPRDTPTF